jgi:hypothetical protein
VRIRVVFSGAFARNGCTKKKPRVIPRHCGPDIGGRAIGITHKELTEVAIEIETPPMVRGLFKSDIRPGERKLHAGAEAST